jgi:hypothetical protein
MNRIVNPFRRGPRIAQFERAVGAFLRRDPIFFLETGERHRLNSFAHSFWQGYDGIDPGFGEGRPGWQTARTYGAYVFWRAGVACRAYDDKGGAQ